MKVFIFDLLPYDQHFEDYKRDKLIPYPLPRDHWDPEIGARTYEQHLAGLGGDGQARLRRRRAERAPHHAARPDDLAEHDGGGGRAAHQEAQVPDPRQPLADPQSAAHRRGAGDGRLHVARPHPVRLRPRRAARIQRLQRADGGIARALRGSGRHHHEGLDRAEVLPRGQVLADARTSRSGRGPTSSRIRRCGCRSPARRKPSSGPASTTSPRCCPTSSAG